MTLYVINVCSYISLYLKKFEQMICSTCAIPHHPRSLQLGICWGYAGDYTRTVAPVGSVGFVFS